MGFGLLAAGYSSVFFFRTVPAELIGFIAVAIAMKKLCYYNKYFKAALFSAYCLVAFSAVDAVFWVLDITGVVALENFTVLPYLHTLLLLPFTVFLLTALKALCTELSFSQGTKRATLAMSFTAVFYIVHIVNIALPTFLGPTLDILSILLFIASLIVNELAILICYKGITTDEAEEEETKKLEQFEKRFRRNKKKK